MPISLVTGGCGFIGSHMADLLLDCGHEVRVLDNFSTGRVSNLRDPQKFDINNRDILTVKEDDRMFHGVDTVFHFAGIGDLIPSIENPSRYMQVNVQGTVEVLEASRRSGVKHFVYAASSSCYGEAPDVPTAEHDPCTPAHPYALSKYLGEQAVLHWGQVYKLPVTSMRIFNAYGPRARTTGAYGAVMGTFLRQKLARAPFTVVGDGRQRRDFIHVSDVCKAFLRASWRSGNGEVFNVGTSNPHSILDLVDILGGEMVSLPDRPGEPDCTWADISKLTRLTGWKPEMDFTDGVRDLLNHIESFKSSPLWTPDTIEAATKDWFKVLG